MADLAITASQVKAGASAVEGTGVAGATITAGQSVYEDATDGRIKLADSNLSLAAAKAKGVALHGALDLDPGDIARRGIEDQHGRSSIDCSAPMGDRQRSRGGA